MFEYEVTSNRVDCYSVLGLAREAAATFRKSFVPPVVKETGNQENVNDYVSVEVLDQELCPRYLARVCKNIKIAPSPQCREGWPPAESGPSIIWWTLPIM